MAGHPFLERTSLADFDYLKFYLEALLDPKADTVYPRRCSVSALSRFTDSLSSNLSNPRFKMYY